MCHLLHKRNVFASFFDQKFEREKRERKKREGEGEKKRERVWTSFSGYFYYFIYFYIFLTIKKVVNQSTVTPLYFSSGNTGAAAKVPFSKLQNFYFFCLFLSSSHFHLPAFPLLALFKWSKYSGWALIRRGTFV